MVEEAPAQPELTGSNAANTEDMDLVSAENAESGANESNTKRAREGEEDDCVAKKQKVGDEDERSVEEQRLEKKLGGGEGESDEKENGSGRATLGPKEFGSSVEMFDYFIKFLHFWPPNLNINKYEHMVLLDLIKKGHPEPDKKIGGGIQAFQLRYHPMWKSKCFFLIREDGTVDDFSFRKCVDHILPLPEDMKMKSEGNKGSSGGGKGRGGKGGGGRGGHGRGRGGKSRN